MTVAADSEGNREGKAKAAFLIVEPSHSQLADISGLLARGQLLAFVDGLVPLEEASSAHLGTAPRSLGYGKVVIDVDQALQP